MPYAYCEQIGKEIRDISDEIPFDIPDSWAWVRLGNVLSIFGRIGFRGYTKADMVTKGKGAITISPSNIKGLDTIFDNCAYITWTKYDESPEIQIENDDLLLVKTGSSYGKCGIVHDLPEKATINPQLVVLKYILIDRKWLLYSLNSSVSKAQYEQFVIGTSIPTFSQEKLSSLVIPIPPLSEQQRIVAKIEELLPYIERYGKAEEHLTALSTTFPEALKKSILQEAVQGKLVPQNPDDEPASVLLERIRAEKQELIKAGKIKRDKHESVIVTRDKIPYEIIDVKERCIADEVPFELPDNWCWCRLRNLLKKSSTGPFGSMLHKSDYADDGVPLINPADIVQGKVSLAKIKRVAYQKADDMDSYRLYTGDIVIGRRGELGRAAIITNAENSYLCGTGCFFITLFSGLDSEYFIKLLESPYLRLKLQEQSVGTTMNNLNHTILENLLIPLPPLAEQQCIVSKIEELMPIISSI